MGVVAILLMLFTAHAQAALPKYITDLQGKTEKKKKTRWTLESWLDTKKRVALMDQWLALNSSSNLFELFLGAAHGSYDVNSAEVAAWRETDQSATTFNAGFFVSLIGIEADLKRLADSDVRSGRVNLRVLGTAEQNTNLTAHYGIRQWRQEALNADFKNAFFGGSLTLYLFKYVGLRGEYSRFAEDRAAGGISSDGSRWEGTLFIEALFLRVFATTYEETFTLKTPTQTAPQKRQGLDIGLKLFF